MVDAQWLEQFSPDGVSQLELTMAESAWQDAREAAAEEKARAEKEAPARTGLAP
jgi:hypothetical protein